jgi:O-antigen/teichoic acid export membrane protein
MGIILLVPEWIYTKYLFSAEFKGIREIILLLSVGIVAFGGNNILAHYFIGCGKIKYCAACSFLGLGTLLLIGCFLIPAKGIPGAALTSSIAYICMLLFSLLVFMRQTRTAARELLPTPGDWEALRSRLFHKHSKH